MKRAVAVGFPFQQYGPSTAKTADHSPTHVNRHLEVWLAEGGVTTNQLADKVGVPQGLIADLVTGKQILTADVAFLLADFFGTSPLYWLKLQRQGCLEARERENAPVSVTM